MVPFFSLGVCLSNIAHRQPMAVLCKLYTIGCNPMHPRYGALPVPYVPVGVTRYCLVAYRYTYALDRCRTLMYSWTFIPMSVSLYNDLADPVLMFWYYWVLRAGPMLCLLS